MPIARESDTKGRSSRRSKIAFLTATTIVLLPGLVAFVLYSHHRRATRAAVSENTGGEQSNLVAEQQLTSTGDLNKALEDYQRIVASDPNDARALDALGTIYARLGQYRKAEDAARQANTLAPTEQAPYEHLSYYYLALQQPEDAHQVIRDAMAKKMDSVGFHKVLYAMAFLAQSGPDKPAMADQVRWFGIHPEDESVGLALASNTAAYSGHLAQSLDFSNRAVDAATHTGNHELAAMWEENAALREAAFGNSDAVGQRVEAGLKLSPTSSQVVVEAALALAISGNTARANSLANDVNTRRPEDTQMQAVWLPTIRAQIAVHKKKGRDAIDELASALPLELGETGLGPTPTCMYSSYIRGQAYLAIDKGMAAATEFQKIVDHPGLVWNCWTGALARLGLARAHMLESEELQDADSDRARASAVVAYKEFLKLWKDADADLPLLNQAKQELERAQQAKD